MKKKKQQKKNNNYRFFGMVSLAIFGVALVLLALGMANTIGGVKRGAIEKTPEAILANAGVSEEKDIFLSVAYYDQHADDCVNIYDDANGAAKRQFEWEDCSYYNKAVETGLVGYELNGEHLPVLKAGRLLSNRGLADTERWFHQVEGKSASYIGALKLEYIAEGAKFYFANQNFYPVDKAEFSSGDAVNKDGHNHLFTMNFAVPFTVLASGEENFEIAADDDTFVFVGDKLVLDMGGIHNAIRGRFLIREDGEVYSGVGDEELAYTGVTLTKGEGAMIRVFHADRDASESKFELGAAGMNLNIVNTKLAENGDGDSMQIAYDPTNPGYEAPLGQSVVIQPDNTKGLVILATVEGVLVVIFAVLVVIAAKMVIRQKITREINANKQGAMLDKLQDKSQSQME